jgi:hypothetical protein
MQAKEKPHRSGAGGKLAAMAPLRPRPAVKFDQKTGDLTIDGLSVNLEVFAKIFGDNPRMLWRFVREGDRIDAVAFDEREVIWLDPTLQSEPEPR